jgi:D-alanyl-D-alanine carboxypeptidase/D-alanyl-D-alanine-endopeptidase (penicillin-binding protein 4)
LRARAPRRASAPGSARPLRGALIAALAVALLAPASSAAATPLAVALLAPASSAAATPLAVALLAPASSAAATPLAVALLAPASSAAATPLAVALLAPASSAAATPLAVALLAPASSAAATPLAERVKAAVEPLGSRVAVQVTDLESRRSVVALRAERRRPLGSTTKLLTAAAALRRLGPGHVLGTQVLAAAPIDGAGIVAGDLVLRGGGDPLLGDAQLNELAGQLASLREVTGSVVGDESAFDAIRTGPSGDGVFDAELGGPLSALAYERGAQVHGGPPQADPARAAAARFDDVLEARGVVIRGTPRAGVAPAGAVTLTSADSAPVAELLEAMLKPSDDWIAEMLTKSMAPAPGSTAAGAAIVRREVARLGARVTLVDGSGLDARDRGTAAGLVSVLRRMRASDAFRSALARPGRAGTLRDRLASGRARRSCRGKTGTLPSGGVSALAGYCEGRNGHTYAFAVMANGADLSRARRAQDRVARALAAAR